MWEEWKLKVNKYIMIYFSCSSNVLLPNLIVKMTCSKIKTKMTFYPRKNSTSRDFSNESAIILVYRHNLYNCGITYFQFVIMSILSLKTNIEVIKVTLHRKVRQV